MIRKKRKKKKNYGTQQRPRLSVKKTNRYIYAQIIDDTVGNTLVFSGSIEKQMRDFKGTKIEIAKEVGRRIGQKALLAGIKKITYDGSPYHGRIKALAEGAREGGLEF